MISGTIKKACTKKRLRPKKRRSLLPHVAALRKTNPYYLATALIGRRLRQSIVVKSEEP